MLNIEHIQSLGDRLQMEALSALRVSTREKGTPYASRYCEPDRRDRQSWTGRSSDSDDDLPLPELGTLNCESWPARARRPRPGRDV